MYFFQIKGNTVSSDSHSGDESCSSNGTLNDLLGNIYQARKPKSVKGSMLDLVHAEYTKYLDVPCMEPDGNPLEFWKINGFLYPHVGNFAKAMLAIPATSVASERVFSTAGNIISSQRACLLPENANMLIFIKHNKEFYDIFK